MGFRNSVFWSILGIIAGGYALLLASLILADILYLGVDAPELFSKTLADEDIRFSIVLSILSCTITAIIAVWVAVPVGYIFARWRPTSQRGKVCKAILDGLMDIPIVLPPLVIGISLLILFTTKFGVWFQDKTTRFVYAVPGLLLAQFVVGCAFAIRAMRTTFDHLPERPELVARTLGASRAQAFFAVTFPAARRGMVSAATVAWARSLGEFGPVLVFAGMVRKKTEVMSTSIYLQLSEGNLDGSVVISLLMVVLAVIILVFVRIYGETGETHDRH